MFQVEALRGHVWLPAGAYVLSAHAVNGAKKASSQLRGVEAVRVIDLCGRVIFSR